jgi:hypothetical protein
MMKRIEIQHASSGKCFGWSVIGRNKSVYGHNKKKSKKRAAGEAARYR